MKVSKKQLDNLLKKIYEYEDDVIVNIHTSFEEALEAAEKEGMELGKEDEEELPPSKFKIGQPVFVVGVRALEYTRVRAIGWDELEEEWNYQVDGLKEPIEESELVELTEEEVDKYYI